MKWKIVNIIFSIIIILEIGIINSDAYISKDESIQTISKVEERSLKDIINNINLKKEVKIRSITNNSDSYSIEVEINSNVIQFIEIINTFVNCDITSYDICFKKDQINGKITLKYSQFS